MVTIAAIPYSVRLQSHKVEYQRYMSLSRTDRLRLLFVPAVYLVERLSVAKAAATISITSADARVYRGWTRDDRVVTLPCAFDETVFNLHQADDGETASPIVLIVGNYRYPPNRHAAYRLMETVIPEVCRQLPEVRFRFVGRDFPADIQHPCVEAAGFVTDLAGEYQGRRRAGGDRKRGGLPIKAVKARAAAGLWSQHPRDRGCGALHSWAWRVPTVCGSTWYRWGRWRTSQQ